MNASKSVGEKALRLAKYISDNRSSMDRERRLEAVVALAALGVFSVRQISHITSVRHPDVLVLVHKSDRTGGRFNVASIPHLLKIIETNRRGQIDNRPFRRAFETGTSVIMISRLTGTPATNVRRRIREAGGRTRA